MSRALVVDDDRAFGLSLVAVLQLEGFTAVSASTLREAASELAAGNVDVLFAGASLPDGSGLELLPDPDVAIVIVTSEPSLALADEALSLGARDCLVKPVDRLRLRMTLAAIARERRLQDEVARLKARR